VTQKVGTAIAILQAIFSFCLVVAAWVALDISEKQWETAQSGIEFVQQQMSLNQDPIVTLPSGHIPVKAGRFTLELHNSGVSEVVDIEAYETCYVVHKPPDGRLRLYPFKLRFVTEGNPVIEQLAPGATGDIEVTCKEYYHQMLQPYLGNPEGALTQILRVRVLSLLSGYKSSNVSWLERWGVSALEAAR